MDPRQASDPRAAAVQSTGQTAATLNLPPGGPDNPEVFVKIIIPDDKALDISQGGKSHQRLKQIQTNCSVYVRLASPGCYFPGSGDERAALLSGFSESVRVALAQLLEAIEDDPSNPLVHMSLPVGIVNSFLHAGGGQVLKYVGQTTHTQISVLPQLPNFDESVIRVQRFSRTPEAPVVCVANATVLTLRMILDTEPDFQFNTTLNYDVAGLASDDFVEYESLPFLSNPQEASRERIELLKLQLVNLAKGDQQTVALNPLSDKVRTEWIQQEMAEIDQIQHYRTQPALLAPTRVQPPSMDEILSNAARIASSVPLDVQCMVRVPRINNKQASAIIGIRGANIKDIQESSGCKIKIIDSPEAVVTGMSGPGATSLKEAVVTGQVNQVHGGLMGIAELMIEADLGATEATSKISHWLRAQRGPSPSSRYNDDRSKRGRR